MRAVAAYRDDGARGNFTPARVNVTTGFDQQQERTS
jgi:hypothetical protein